MRWSSRKFLGSAATIAIGLSLAVPARAAMATTASTTTTVQSSVPSSTYDSPVTFTAQVTAPAGTPTGSVIFTDISNGSILATKKVLSNGVASFTTAALAPGARRVQAHYSGDASFSHSFSAPMDIPVANGASSSLAYQVDARHDGNQSVGKLTPASLTK
ncbi:MAG: Ig-like domain-containing protein, partial [Streptosporangiaceae bacterium]